MAGRNLVQEANYQHVAVSLRKVFASSIQFWTNEQSGRDWDKVVVLKLKTIEFLGISPFLKLQSYTDKSPFSRGKNQVIKCLLTRSILGQTIGY